MLMEIFKETANEELVKCKCGIDNKDFEQISSSAHSIKGSAANLMLDEISKCSKVIELSAKHKDNIDYLNEYNILKELIYTL